MTQLADSLQALIDHYRETLGLYRQLEELSKRIFDAFEDPSQLATLGETLKEKIAVVSRIEEQSQKITALKRDMQLTGPERDLVRRAEEELTDIVKRVVDHEDRSRYLFEKQGVKIQRR